MTRTIPALVRPTVTYWPAGTHRLATPLTPTVKPPPPVPTEVERIVMELLACATLTLSRTLSG